MEKQTFKIPDGVDSIEVSQHDGKIVLEFVPVKRKNGDILTVQDGSDKWVMIFKQQAKNSTTVYFHAMLEYDGKLTLNYHTGNDDFRPATEEEKQLLFDKLKENGKRWIT